MREPQVPVFPSLAQEESPSLQPGFCGHTEDTWPGAPGSGNDVMCPTSLELIKSGRVVHVPEAPRACLAMC